jgi:hypothetical protein
MAIGGANRKKGRHRKHKQERRDDTKTTTQSISTGLGLRRAKNTWKTTDSRNRLPGFFPKC